MNMTDNDKEQKPWHHLFGGDLDVFASQFPKTAERIRKAIYAANHTAKLEQAASGFEEWPGKINQSKDTDVYRWQESAWEACAASQSAKIAALTEEVAELQQSLDLRHKASLRAVAMWREKTGKELTIPDHADLCCWLEEEVEKWKREALTCANAEYLRKQLQSAQLDNKRLREVSVDAEKTLEHCYMPRGKQHWLADTLNNIRKSLSTPLDTSAADELLARMADWERRSESCESKLGQLEANEKLTAARSALEDEKCVWSGISNDVTNEKWLVTIAKHRVASITHALGEEQKKEGE